MPLLLLAGAAWWSWTIVQAETRARMVRTVNALHDQGLRGFEVQEALLSAMQLHTAGMSWPEIAASAEVAAFVSGLDTKNRGARAIAMISPEGQVVHFSGGPFPPPAINLSGLDYVQAQRGAHPGPFIGATGAGRLVENLRFSYSRPRLDVQGRPDGGTLVAAFQLEPIENFYASVAETPQDIVALVRLDGAILVRHPRLPTPIGSHLTPESPAMRALMAAVPGQVEFETGVSIFDHQPRLLAVRLFAQYPVAIIYGLHVNGPRQAWLRQVYALAAITGATMLLLLGLTWLLHGHTQRTAGALLREHKALVAARQEAEARAEAEMALRHGQRLAVLGQIVAGVAHDFRNVTQAVQGGALLIAQALDRDDTARARTLAAMIAEAAGRGVDLTQRMLRGIGRHDASADPSSGDDADDQAEARMAVLDPAVVLEAATDLLRRTIGAGYVVRLAQGAALPVAVRGNPAELEAALLNLALNARDAMLSGGEIIIEAVLEQVGPGHPERLSPGRYARIRVSDSGLGMDAKTLLRVAQPFFTTKPPGQGTGLGLATARAFARDAGGALSIASPGPGRGTTVTLWLPEVSTQGAA